jgi:hypothetical protein
MFSLPIFMPSELSQVSQILWDACRCHSEYLVPLPPGQIRPLTTYFLYYACKTFWMSHSGLVKGFLDGLEGEKWWDWSQVSAPSPATIPGYIDLPACLLGL